MPRRPFRSFDGRPLIIGGGQALPYLAEDDRDGGTVEQAARRVGLVLARASRVLGEEPFYHEFIEGLERVLAPAGVSVLVKVVTDRAAENATYETWAEHDRVNGVLLVDLLPGDDRIALTARLRLPAAVLGDPAVAPGLPAVRTDDVGWARAAIRHLADRGHRIVGHVSGPVSFVHTQLRRTGTEQEAQECGVTLLRATGNYSYESGRAATAELLPGRPSAIVYDNDLMALAGLEAARDAGLAVPADLSVIAWDDSAQCQLATPALSAMSHDVSRIGELAAEAVLDALTGAPPTIREAPAARLVIRDSSR